jgi:hypothetical protein
MYARPCSSVPDTVTGAEPRNVLIIPWPVRNQMGMPKVKPKASYVMELYTHPEQGFDFNVECRQSRTMRKTYGTWLCFAHFPDVRFAPTFQTRIVADIKPAYNRFYFHSVHSLACSSFAPSVAFLSLSPGCITGSPMNPLSGKGRPSRKKTTDTADPLESSFRTCLPDGHGLVGLTQIMLWSRRRLMLG